ncbi:MAG: acylphosphatase [candidate division Zixibacteria bacterium]|nr:acylphosphatase [candidate division Zixibacteria bacterium]
MTLNNVRIIVSGLVQGVSFRYFTYKTAINLGITGYARNLPTGQVEIIACGDKGMIDELVEAVRIGPSYSSVSDVQLEEIPMVETYSKFDIR